MDNLAQIIASCFVNSLWEVALVGGAAWMVSRLFKRLGPGVQHLMWVTSLMLAVITPFLPLLRLVLADIGFRTVPQDHSFLISAATRGSQPLSSGGLLVSQSSVLTLFFLFFGVLVFYATRLAWSLHYTIALRREAYPISLGPEAELLWSRCKQAFSLKQARLLCSENIAGPVTIGFIRPALLVSGGFLEECGRHDFFAALAHECAHIKRRDFQKNLLYEIATLAIAYHPVAWFVKAQIARTREMICDDLATEKLIDRRSYAESLLRLAKMISLAAGALTSSAIGIFDGNVLEERIMMINKTKQHLSPIMRYAAMSASVLFLLSVAAGIAAMARPIGALSQAGSPDANSSKRGSHVDLSCTYYTQDAQNQAFEGTCETHKKDKVNYYCGVVLGGKKLSELQGGCEWKIQRAKAQGVKGLEK